MFNHAEELFQELIDKKLEIYPSQFNIFLQEMINSNQIEKAHKLFKQIPNLNHFNYSTLISGYLKLDPEMVGKLFEEMLGKNIAIQSSQINLYLVKLINKTNIQNAHDWCKKFKVPLDSYCYTTLIHGYLKVNDLENVGELFQEMIDGRIEIQPNQFNIFINEMSKQQRIEEVHNIFRQIPNLNQINYATLIHVYLIRNDLKNVEILFRELIDKGEIFSAALLHQFNKFMSKMISDSKLDTAVELFHKIPNKNQTICSTLIQKYLDMEEIDVITKLFQEMINQNISISRVQFRKFLLAANARQDFETIEKFKKQKDQIIYMKYSHQENHRE